MTTTKVREHPIPFSGPMVRAFPHKTQTRRFIKDQSHAETFKLNNGVLSRHHPTGIVAVAAKYQVGDVLYVREAWRALPEWDHVPPSKLHLGAAICYEADKDSDDMGWGKPRQAMFMCKWMARHWIEVTGVRVQRIQEISEEDAIAEGFTEKWTCLHPGIASYAIESTAVEMFAAYINKLSAKRGYGWDTNHWVYAVEFKEATR